MLMLWLVGCLRDDACFGQDDGLGGDSGRVTCKMPSVIATPSARSTFWTQSVWLPRYARRGRQANRARHDRFRIAAARTGLRGPTAAADHPGAGGWTFGPVLAPCVSATPVTGTAELGVGRPLDVVIGPCASLTDIEALVDDVDRAPGFVVLRRRFGGGSYRCSGHIDNVGILVRWLLAHPCVGAAIVAEGTIRVTPGGVTA